MAHRVSRPGKLDSEGSRHEVCQTRCQPAAPQALHLRQRALRTPRVNASAMGVRELNPRPCLKRRSEGEVTNWRLPMNWPTIAAAALVALIAGCAHSGSTVPERGTGSLEERQAGFLSALGAGDLDGTVAYFAEDAVLHIANMPPHRGRAAIRGLYENVFRFSTASEHLPESLTIASGGDMAYGFGSVNTVFAREGGPVAYAGKYLLVWERLDGEWLIAAYSISNDGSE